MRSQQEVEEMLTIVRFFGDTQAVKALEWVLSHDPPKGGNGDLPQLQQPDSQ